MIPDEFTIKKVLIPIRFFYPSGAGPAMIIIHAKTSTIDILGSILLIITR